MMNLIIYCRSQLPGHGPFCPSHQGTGPGRPAENGVSEGTHSLSSDKLCDSSSSFPLWEPQFNSSGKWG